MMSNNCEGIAIRFMLTLTSYVYLFVASLQLSGRGNQYCPLSQRRGFATTMTMTQNEVGVGFTDIFEDSLEEVQPRKLTVLGELPKWLSGTVIKNGPAVFGTQGGSRLSRRYDHIFDGLAKLHKYEIRNGEVVFSSRFLRSDWYRRIVENKEDLPPSITTGPVIPPFNAAQKLTAALTSSSAFDNVPVNVHNLGGKTWVAVTDAPVMLGFDPRSLETKGRYSFKNDITSLGGIELFSTAHPHLCKEKKRARQSQDKESALKEGEDEEYQEGEEEMFTYNYYFELRPIALPGLPPTNLAHIVRINDEGYREIVGTVPVEGNTIPYVHDFSMTENYIILCLWPVRIDMSKMVTSDRGFLRELDWCKADETGKKTLIHVFKIKNDPGSPPIATFTASPMFAYHHVNAYEVDSSNGRDIVMDVTGYPSASIANGAHGYALISNMQDKAKRSKQERDGNCYRYRLPLSSGAVDGQVPPPQLLKAVGKNGKIYGSELVRINDDFKGRLYRYSYGYTGFAGSAESGGGGFLEWGIVKLDHRTAEAGSFGSITATVWESPNCYPSECVFVPRTRGVSGKDEDDGVLLSQIYDGVKKESFLLVIDAKNMIELARCYTGVKCPTSFHGQFIDDRDKRKLT